MRKAKPLGMLERGVWVAPWMGPDGEMVLLAITSRAQLATGVPTIVPNGASQVEASDRLWDIVEAVDPDVRAQLRVI